MDKLLDGVRVLDVSTFSPVRFGTTVLADLGATVIQIDKPAAARPAGPLDLLDSPEHPRWLWHSRNKCSVVINLKQDEGRAVFYDLLATADVVVEGFAAGAAAREMLAKQGKKPLRITRPMTRRKNESRRSVEDGERDAINLLHHYDSRVRP